MFKKILLLLLSLNILGCEKKMSMHDYLTQNTFDVIIDVREIDEYNNGHVKDAIHIPLGDIISLNLDKDTKIAVYCRSGNRSGQAKNKLEEMGYTNVINIGGIIDNSVELVK